MGEHGPYWDPDKLVPCGTVSAAKHHYRRGEPLDEACRMAARGEKAGQQAGVRSIDRRGIRNGLPAFVPYRYRGTGTDTLTWWMT